MNFRVDIHCEAGLQHLPRPLRVMGVSTSAALHRIEQRALGSGDIGMVILLLQGTWAHSAGNMHLAPGTALLWPGPGVDSLQASGDGPWQWLGMTFTGASHLAAELAAQLPAGVCQVPLGSGLIQQLLRFERTDGQRLTINRAEAARQVLSALATVADHGLAGGAASYSHLVRQALEWLQAHIEDSGGIAQLAQALQVSQEHLTRIFSEQTGQSPGHYLAALKLRRACELLKSTTLPVADIGARLGYENPSHFTRLFRQATGMTPTHYRERESVPLL